MITNQGSTPNRLADSVVSFTMLLVASILLLASIQANLSWAHENDITTKNIYLPSTMRSEGRVTISYTYGDESKKTQHHFSFSESIDEVTKRSRVSIGYISHDPREYVSINGAPLIRLDDQGNCVKGERENEFVPELDWFAKWIYDESELKSFLKNNPHAVGPSGFIRMFKHLNPDLEVNYIMATVERNIDCSLYGVQYKRRLSEDVKLEILIPSKSYFDTTKVPIFTFREKTMHVVGPKESSNSEMLYDVSITIDYFNIQTQDDQLAQSNKMEGDFNLPEARGCSELVSSLFPVHIEFESSFIMTYYQKSAITHVTLAYDYKYDYLRKEMFGKTVSIWDLEDGLLYHIDASLSSTNQVSTNDFQEVRMKQCSILKVTDTKLGSAYRPYDREGVPLSIHDFFGISKLGYIGLGRVRDFPTVIFEAVLTEPPKLFGLSADYTKVDKHFIVQYHLINADLKKKNKSPLDRSVENFWPLKITLFEQDKAHNTYMMIDQLEIDDFHWGLMGWERKPGELFMATECFDDEYEQVHLELAIDFRLRNDFDRKLLAHNKYKLEADLLNDIFNTIKVRRVHLVEYELSLRPHNVILNMVIGDRRETRSLVKFSDNEIPVIESRMDKDSILISGLVEQDCISRVSLIRDAQFVVYCPDSTTERSSCRAYTQDIGFSVTQKGVVGSRLDGCQFYRFDYEHSPPSATSTWSQWRDKLRNHEFTFNFEAPDKRPMSFKGSIQDLDITREMPLEKVVNFRFELDETNNEPVDSLKRNLRYFESIEYKSISDCSKICNLDTHCRSYSYCSINSAPSASKSQLKSSPNCILASLDLRASEVNDQLTRSTLLDSIQVLDVTANNYKLVLDPSCDIYERDYLSMFTITDEVIQLDESLAKQLHDEASSFDCAKSGIDLEASHPEHHVAMFAYCAYSGICLLDENLFSQVKGDQEAEPTTGNRDADTDDEPKGHELPCNVYRRRYQSYFKVSAHILKPDPMKQVELKLNSVEECARACWNQFGHVCGSFDYCWPASCFINQVASSDDLQLSADNLELRPDCLHYDRDLELDKLRAEHLIGRHSILLADHSTGGSGRGQTFARFFVNVFLFCMVSVSFVLGLIVGRQVNDRLETVTIVRQSFSAGSGGLRRVSRAFGATMARLGGAASGFGGLGAANTLSSGHRKFSTSDELNHEAGRAMEGFEPSLSAIQLEEFKQNRTIEEEQEPDDGQSGGDHSQRFGLGGFGSASVDLGRTVAFGSGDADLAGKVDFGSENAEPGRTVTFGSASADLGPNSDSIASHVNTQQNVDDLLQL